MLQDNFPDPIASDARERNSVADIERNVVTELLCGNALLRAGLAHLLSGTCFEVLSATQDRSAPSSTSHQTEPALYVVDATGPVEQVLTFIQQAKEKHPSARVVVVANQAERQLLQSTVSAGIDSFCLATSGREVLIKTLELTMLGEKILPGSLLRSLFEQASLASNSAQVISLAPPPVPDPRAQKLSRRETVILQSLMGGDPNKVIARKLDITEATIKVHVKAILRKIGVANRTQAAMWATGNLRTPEAPMADRPEVHRLS